MINHSLGTYKCCSSSFLLLYDPIYATISSILIMQCDVARCTACIPNKAEYLHKEHSYKNSTEEVIL